MVIPVCDFSVLFMLSKKDYPQLYAYAINHLQVTLSELNV